MSVVAVGAPSVKSGDIRVRSLPKAHLHLHFEHCICPDTLTEFASRYGVQLDDFYRFTTLSEFLRRSPILRRCVSDINDLQRICRELVREEAKDSVLYVEPMVNFLNWVPKFGDLDEVFHVVREAFSEAGEMHGVEVGIMMGFSRHRDSIEKVEELAHFAAEHARDGVVAFGFGGDETLAGPEQFVRACAIAREADLLIVPHAGEVMGADSIARTIELLHPDRVAHGVRAVEDPRVLRTLRDQNIACDVCPTSNLRLGVVSDIKRHPIKDMLDAGVKVTLNTDDPLEFGVRASDEYKLVREAFDFSDQRLAEIARTSVLVSGASQFTKERILHRIDNWLAEG